LSTAGYGRPTELRGRPATAVTATLSRYAAAARLYAQSGPITRRDGNLVKNPLHQVARDNADEVRQFARELGLSPSARVGLRIEPERALDALTADIGLPPRLRVVGDVG
jgi:P27 family predicted phage terminase small subunit